MLYLLLLHAVKISECCLHKCASALQNLILVGSLICVAALQYCSADDCRPADQALK